MLDRDVVVLVLSNAIGSLEDYAHISRTCLLFNDAAVSKGVLSAVVSAATSRARQAHDEAVEAGKTAREKVATAGTNAVTFDLRLDAVGQLADQQQARRARRLRFTLGKDLVGRNLLQN